MRTVPSSSAVCGMTLKVSPALIMHTDTTANFERIDVARGDRLQGGDDVAGHQDRVDAVMRTRRMGALALDGDAEAIRRRHDRSRADGELADRQARHVVHAVDFLDAEALHQAVLHHGVGAAAAFFGGLEDHDGGAVEIARLGQVFGGAQQHGGMTVMAAGMHLAGSSRLVGQVGRLLDGKRVHVGAKADDLAGGVRAGRG